MLADGLTTHPRQRHKRRIVQVDFADAEIGVSLVGSIAVIHALVVDADRILTALRNRPRLVD